MDSFDCMCLYHINYCLEGEGMPSQLQNPDSYQFAYSHLKNWLYVANTYYWGRDESTIEKNSTRAFFFFT